MVNKQEVITVLRRGVVYSLDSKERIAGLYYKDRAYIINYLWDCLYYILKNEGLYEGKSFDELYHMLERMLEVFENNDLTRGVHIQITDEDNYFIDNELVNTGLLSVIDLFEKLGIGM